LRPFTSDPDEALIPGIARGEPAAVRAFVAAKLPRMMALATRLLGDRIEAEDVAQEVFVRCWRQAERWTPGGARFDTWMHRVALNLCYDRLRKRRDVTMDVLPDRADEGPAPDAGLVSRDTGAAVTAALAALPDRQREAIVLVHYQELGNIEAAEVLEISVEALESLLSRGRRTLRAKLAELRMV
jgi:RNA polymerase sigma factor (sigma-70 family)